VVYTLPMWFLVARKKLLDLYAGSIAHKWWSDADSLPSRLGCQFKEACKSGSCSISEGEYCRFRDLMLVTDCWHGNSRDDTTW